jgi:5-methylcytosine-specific restriction endonuclease McrA
MSANYVPVVDTNHKTVGLFHPAYIRKALKAGQVAILRRFPFTVITKGVTPETYTAPAYRLKLDPGAKTTGIAILNGAHVVWAAELTHRGNAIRDALTSRRQLRSSRRSRKTRYRQPRFLNRTRTKGWLPPSLMSRVHNVVTWARRLAKVINITDISVETVSFDMQALKNPEISGVEYQQGLLLGYELRQYLLEKWGRQCCYCGQKDTPLQVEHIHPKSRGGSNRVGNLTLACNSCNVSKGSRDIRDFLSGKPKVLALILGRMDKPLNSAAAVNATRWELWRQLTATGRPVEVGTGGRTKFNRAQQGIPKTHWTDAACVGASTPLLTFCTTQPLLIKATGHGNRQVIHVDKYGFQRRNKSGELVRKSALVKEVKGFRTGDMVKAVVTAGTKIGTYVGRVAIRTRGSFNVATTAGTIQGIGHRYCTAIHRGDGYGYAF